MKYYAYKMAHDYGFAPNPFFGTCTLANCKSKIRLGVGPGDWIIGTGSKKMGLKNHLIHVMQVASKITFDEYWSDPQFSVKRPVYNGSLARLHGDNIYYLNVDGAFGQLRSFHSHEDGSPHGGHMERDLKGKFVLLSNNFWYFGDKNFAVPDEYLNAISDVRDTKLIKDQELASEFIKWITNNYSQGIHGFPINWIEYQQLRLFA
ncbi:hypothetical protein [Mucilaginibacter sp. AK015]|uniref:Nmad2 family putative nucleotide modification protein n=1 Tax=Mucilaginibacter sp. AK015 TaxID=2723072 RepID=UPI00161FB25A|nr:hypothetical protein [Mucilaginibacter sp. AK015]MBB5396198.1 hypothetical protein [Mucilaginibacter sp. AK015]